MPRFYYSEDFELADHPVVLRTPPLHRGELGTYRRGICPPPCGGAISRRGGLFHWAGFVKYI